MDLPSTLELVGRLCLAVLLGGLIGLERELRDHPAGLRTHLTVAVGSALFVIVGAYGFDDFSTGRTATNISVSVDRVASTVVTGIGFLGGGAILKYGANVKGLTTAGSLWVTAAVGVGCALGSYTITVVATLATLLSLVALRAPERWIQRRWALDRQTVIVSLRADADPAAAIACLARLEGVQLRSLTIRTEADATLLEATVISDRPAELAEMLAPVAVQDDVTAVDLG